MRMQMIPLCLRCLICNFSFMIAFYFLFFFCPSHSIASLSLSYCWAILKLKEYKLVKNQLSITNQILKNKTCTNRDESNHTYVNIKIPVLFFFHLHSSVISFSPYHHYCNFLFSLFFPLSSHAHLPPFPVFSGCPKHKRKKFHQ